MSILKGITLDASRIDDMHSAVLDLAAKWSNEISLARHEGLSDVADHMQYMLDGLVGTFSGFEVEKKSSPPETTVDRLAANILAQIRDMQTNGYDAGRGHELLPQVKSFSELHDYIDANVGWGEDFEKACEEASEFPDIANPVFDRVDRALRLGIYALRMATKEPADPVETAAQALWEAFPTLHEDFTFEFFATMARIVLATASDEKDRGKKSPEREEAIQRLMGKAPRGAKEETKS
jgi:hypothetical protein